MIEITDEMVARFRLALGLDPAPHSEWVKRGLEAALNPSAELEIVVTDMQIYVACGVWQEAFPTETRTKDWANAITKAYRAMRRLEPLSTRTRSGRERRVVKSTATEAAGYRLARGDNGRIRDKDRRK